MSNQRPPYDRCGHLRRDLSWCNAPAIVSFRYADGIGACSDHLGQVLLWCMEKNGRGELPDRVVEAVPTWRWDDLNLERSARS